MRKLQLTQSKFAFIDDRYYDEISEMSWCAKSIKGIMYAMRSMKTAHGYKSIMLQRYVYELAFGKIPDGMQIRFKDHNPLNCQIKNLTPQKRFLENAGDE